jgi:hypothetical protein
VTLRRARLSVEYKRDSAAIEIMAHFSSVAEAATLAWPLHRCPGSPEGEAATTHLRPMTRLVVRNGSSVGSTGDGAAYLAEFAPAAIARALPELVPSGSPGETTGSVETAVWTEESLQAELGPVAVGQGDGEDSGSGDAPVPLAALR